MANAPVGLIWANGKLMVETPVPKNDEQSLTGFQPTYMREATEEEKQACWVCINCDEVKGSHMPDGACYFSPTHFEAKKKELKDAHGQVVETEPEIRTQNRNILATFWKSAK